ncbi:MAG: hypothetical protein J1E99_03540 [Muribaculaceae bacterium]|nr:hypothetical protein [Muribaculaceae bacterium]
MKKLFLSFAVIASVSLFSCGNKAEKEAAAEEAEAEQVEVVEEGACCASDSCAADSCAEVAGEVVEVAE